MAVENLWYRSVVNDWNWGYGGWGVVGVANWWCRCTSLLVRAWLDEIGSSLMAGWKYNMLEALARGLLWWHCWRSPIYSSGCVGVDSGHLAESIVCLGFRSARSMLKMNNIFFFLVVIRKAKGFFIKSTSIVNYDSIQALID
jgi:hypothetical protein